jgi:hypothetical protein
MTIAEATLDRPHADAAWAPVEAQMHYLVDASVKPVTYNPPPGTGLPRRVGNYADFRVSIRDARPLAPALSLDCEGFRLVRHETAMRDFSDAAARRAVYEPELELLLREATGAARVLVFDHTIRVADGALARGVRAPVQLVHNDYTDRSAPQRVRDLLPPAEAERLLARRFAEINVWRPIAGPVRSWPLALVDAGSLAPEDLVTADLVYEDRTGEIFHGRYNPAHRWYWFPEMRREEAVLIKCYDSARDGRARFSLHSAFWNPATPAGAPPRESIESRCFAFF